VGFVLLMRKVAEGEPHAGLPLLNGGAIAGFFVGAYVVGVTPLEALGI
jgi:presenilin-like A22 family membrane protease